jgi:hypothetical protein
MQYATIGHELTHLWQNNNIGLVHLDLGPNFPIRDQPMERHAESVGRAFADRVLGIVP